MSADHLALDKPKSISADATAQEMVRFWLSENTDHVSLMVGGAANMKEEAPMWGYILADIARHVTKAIRETNPDGPDAKQVMTEIMDGFAERLRQAPELSGGVEEVEN